MRSRKLQMLGACLIAQVGLMMTAVAHPGPPGHVHPEEWPFGSLAVIAGVLLLVGVAKVSKGRLRR